MMASTSLKGSFLFISMVLSCVFGHPDPFPDLEDELRGDIVCEQKMTCGGQYPGYHNDTFPIEEIKYGPWASCQCDELCHYFGDCCRDVRTYPEVLHQSLNEELMTCVYMKELYNSVYRIQKCPQMYQSPDLVEKCEGEREGDLSTGNIIERIPVSHKKTGLLFKNVFCAICNGFSHESDIVFWNVSIHFYPAGMDPRTIAKQNESISTQINSSNLQMMGFIIEEPQGIAKARKCEENVIDTCPPTYQENSFIELCLNHTAYYHHRSDVYKNKYCAFCNNVTLSQLSCGLDFGRSRGQPGVLGFPPYQVLLDFNSGSGSLFDRNGQRSDHKASVASCPTGYKYNPFSDECVFLHCPSGSVLTNNTCQPSMAGYTHNITHACPHIIINSTDFTILPDGMAYLNSSGVLLNYSEYDLSYDASYLTVCYRDFVYKHNFESPWKNTADDIQGIITLIGLILSLIGLLVLIVVYSIFKKLQNTPGKALLALSVSLFIGQLLFLISSTVVEVRIACVIIAVMMHYSFLASFFWMNILAYDVWRTFNKQYQLMSNGSKHKRFLKYAIYAFGLPLLIVLTCAALDIAGGTLDPVFIPRYGIDICWIRNKYIIFAAFAVPLGLIILTNFVFFSMSVYYIHKSVQSTKVVQEKSSGKRRLLLYLKLSTIVGLTWLFGFIANFVQASKVFWYLFTIFNTLQGLFICFGFVCTRTVYRLAKTASQTSTASTLNTKRTRSSTL